MNELAGKRVYLSGAISNRPANEWRAEFNAAEALCKRLGAKGVYNPSRTADMYRGHTEEAYMRHSINEMTRGNIHRSEADYDAIALLPSWRDSKGAQLEALVAKAIGLQVFDIAEYEREQR